MLHEGGTNLSATLFCPIKCFLYTLMRNLTVTLVHAFAGLLSLWEAILWEAVTLCRKESLLSSLNNLGLNLDTATY